MVKAEKAFKWGVAIVVIFGILNALFFLNLVIGLKIVLPILCIFLIGSILLQSGKGGGLAAIGGLGDQSAFGTRTSTFLTKITYLVGAAFIVATIFLFKLSIPTQSINTMITREVPAAPHEHEHHDHPGEHEHGAVPHAEGEPEKTAPFGMQNVGGQPNQSLPENQNHQAMMKGKTSPDQPIGMTSVGEEKQPADVTGKPVAEDQKEAGK